MIQPTRWCCWWFRTHAVSPPLSAPSTHHRAQQGPPIHHHRTNHLLIYSHQWHPPHHLLPPLTQEAESYANDNGIFFMETSAKTATNVNELFVAIGAPRAPLHRCRDGPPKQSRPDSTLCKHTQEHVHAHAHMHVSHARHMHAQFMSVVPTRSPKAAEEHSATSAWWGTKSRQCSIASARRKERVLLR
jgi:hypothetical protein